MERLLVVGSAGLVGSRLASLAESHGFEAYGTQRSRRSRLPRTVDADITDHDATLELVRRIQPSVIINTAAVTNVDYCETHKNEARMVNVEGVRNLAEAAKICNSRLIQVSTDFVFDGKTGQYEEVDATNPLQYYGQTKLDSEKIVEKLPSYAVARPSVIYGWDPPEPDKEGSESTKPMNFAMFVWDRLKRNELVKAVTDQYSSPTFSDNLANVLLALAKHHENGVFHTAGGSCLSRYEFAVKLADIFGYPRSMIKPVLSSDFRQVATRPRNSCLRVENVEKALGVRMLTPEEGLREMRKQSLIRVSK